jgi:uncharacterized OB-fold protein
MGKEILAPSGSPLKEDDFERQRVLSITYHPKVAYRWATGIAIGRFLQEMKAGRILGSRCGHCNRVVVPPRVFCEYCFRKIDDWPNLPDTGIVNTYSISHIAADTTRLKTPIIPAVIEIDGTSNAGFLHILGGVEQGKVKIGMRVKAVWKDSAQRQGSITDIRHFAPLR